MARLVVLIRNNDRGFTRGFFYGRIGFTTASPDNVSDYGWVGVGSMSAATPIFSNKTSIAVRNQFVPEDQGREPDSILQSGFWADANTFEASGTIVSVRITC
jgi:hypothetical protein